MPFLIQVLSFDDMYDQYSFSNFFSTGALVFAQFRDPSTHPPTHHPTFSFRSPETSQIQFLEEVSTSHFVGAIP